MAHRFWFGVAMSAALGAALCLIEVIPGPKRGRAKPTAMPITLPTAKPTAAPTHSANLTASRAEWGGESFPAPAAAPGWLTGPEKNLPEAEAIRPRTPFSPAPHAPAAPAPQQPPQQQAAAVPSFPALPALPPPSLPSRLSSQSPPAEAAPAPRPRLAPSAQNRRKGSPSPMLPLRRMLSGRSGGVGSAPGGSRSRRLPAADPAPASGASASSGTALANLADVREIDPTWDYYDLPEKGLDVWAGGQGFAAKQSLRDAGLDAYELDGRVYSLGLKKDWSIDSVIGASVDIFDAKLTSGAMLDYRENDLSGYRLNAHYEGVAFDYLAFAVTAFYGRLDSEGGGSLQIHYQGDSWREEWREDRHGSEMYGFAAKAGIPLLWGPDIKVLPEMGVNLTKLRTDEYAYSLSSSRHNERPFQAARVDSTSLTIPLAVTFRKDMLQSWGVLTPLLGLTYTVELDDSATGVRAGNASAASLVAVDPATGNTSAMAAGVSPKAFVRVDLGLELRTVGGWRMDARYAHVFSEKYTNDIFKLELGRCF